MYTFGVIARQNICYRFAATATCEIDATHGFRDYVLYKKISGKSDAVALRAHVPVQLHVFWLDQKYDTPP